MSMILFWLGEVLAEEVWKIIGSKTSLSGVPLVRLEVWSPYVPCLPQESARSLIDKVSQSILKTKDEHRKTVDPRIHHFSSSRLAMFANAITVFLAVGGLSIPVFLLFLVPMARGLMACLALGFVLAFSVTMSVVTGARVQDVLVGTAAWVLEVIVSLFDADCEAGMEQWWLCS